MIFLYTKKIYLGWGKAEELPGLFADVRGVEAVILGRITSDSEAKEWEGIEISYNPKLTDISTLLDIFFGFVNPYLPERDTAEGRHIMNGVVCYVSAEDLPQIEMYMTFLAARGKSPQVGSAAITVNDTTRQEIYNRRLYAVCLALGNFKK